MSIPARSKLYRVGQLVNNGSAAYSQGQAMGSKFGLVVQNVGGRGILLHRINIVDGENNTVNDQKINIFSADFTATADGSAWVIASVADAKNYVGQFGIAHAGFTAAGTIATGSIDVSRSIFLIGNSIYFQAQADGAVDTTAGSTFTYEFIYERLS